MSRLTVCVRLLRASQPLLIAVHNYFINIELIVVTCLLELCRLHMMVRNMTGVVNCHGVCTFSLLYWDVSGIICVKRLAEFDGLRRRSVCLVE
jgi:hypothetical protein